jgi:hypothetical protein
MAKRGTSQFYRDEAERLMALAAGSINPELRLELLQIAASFKKLADRAAQQQSVDAAAVAKSA